MTAALSPIRRPDDEREEDSGGDDVVPRASRRSSHAPHLFMCGAGGRDGVVVCVHGPAGLVCVCAHPQSAAAGTELIFSRPTEGIAVYFDIAFMAGLVLAAPIIMYQVWLFVAPALYANEKKFVIPFVGLTGCRKRGGCGVQSLRAVPVDDELLRDLHVGRHHGSSRAWSTCSSCTSGRWSAWCWCSRFPTLAFFLAKMRVITSRFLWRNLRYAILIIFIVAAVLTPSPDPWNMTIFAMPMLGAVSHRHRRRLACRAQTTSNESCRPPAGLRGGCARSGVEAPDASTIAVR